MAEACYDKHWVTLLQGVTLLPPTRSVTNREKKLPDSQLLQKSL